MELSTSIPTANEIPARLTTFRFRPIIHMKTKVPMAEIGIAKGKKAPDKRATEAKRDWQRDKARLLRERG